MYSAAWPSLGQVVKFNGRQPHRARTAPAPSSSLTSSSTRNVMSRLTRGMGPAFLAEAGHWAAPWQGQRRCGHFLFCLHSVDFAANAANKILSVAKLQKKDSCAVVIRVLPSTAAEWVNRDVEARPVLTFQNVCLININKRKLTFKISFVPLFAKVLSNACAIMVQKVARPWSSACLLCRALIFMCVLCIRERCSHD